MSHSCHPALVGRSRFAAHQDHPSSDLYRRQKRCARCRAYLGKRRCILLFQYSTPYFSPSPFNALMTDENSPGGTSILDSSSNSPSIPDGVKKNSVFAVSSPLLRIRNAIHTVVPLIGETGHAGSDAMTQLLARQAPAGPSLSSRGAQRRRCTVLGRSRASVSPTVRARPVSCSKSAVLKSLLP